jgi:very-short-patch-repair endonuclease
MNMTETPLTNSTLLRCFKRQCLYCGKPFTTTVGRQKYCFNCGGIYRAGRLKTETSVCQFCGVEFRHTPRSSGIYCSPKCGGMDIMANRMPYKETSIEKIIKEKLIENNISFKQQEPIETISVVDFYLPTYKTVIYCDGDYWHSSEGTRAKDDLQSEALTQHGYKVFRFNEEGIKNTPDKLVGYVKDYILNYNYRYRSELNI